MYLPKVCLDVYRREWKRARSGIRKDLYSVNKCHMFLCMLKYSSGKEKLSDTSMVFNWIFMPQAWMLFLLTQRKHFLQSTPLWYRVSAEILNYLSEVLRNQQPRWKFKPFSISEVNLIPCTTDYEIQMPGFDLQIQSFLPVSKLSDNSSKEKKKIEENINFFWWKKK